jgi:branched-subunit amino acid aminotransferase/4-amino-4-deoxychorismate lyase
MATPSGITRQRSFELLREAGIGIQRYANLAQAAEISSPGAVAELSAVARIERSRTAAGPDFPQSQRPVSGVRAESRLWGGI